MIHKKKPTQIEKYSLQPEVVVRDDADGEITVLNLRRGRYWRGNSSAKLILELLEEPIYLDCILRHLLDRYDAPEEQVKSDIQEPLSDLLHAGLIRKA